MVEKKKVYMTVKRTLEWSIEKELTEAEYKKFKSEYNNDFRKKQSDKLKKLGCNSKNVDYINDEIDIYNSEWDEVKIDCLDLLDLYKK